MAKLHHPTIINVARVLQFIVSLVAGGLCAWGITCFGSYVGYVVTFWSSFWTTVFMVFRLIEHFRSHNAWHVLALCIEALVVLSWLVATVTLAILNASLGRWEDRWEQRIGEYYRGSSLDEIFTDTGRGSLKGSYAANALTGLLFISFVITFATYIHTYRKAKGDGAKYPQMSSA